jgi:lipopolysaccharide/colanic/teichoic acid biosynthesis glycosyltransferase
MQNEADIETIRKIDPDALQLVDKKRSGYYLVKRIVDIIFSALLLLGFSPIFLIIIVAIKIYSPGPVFYIQKRVGARRVKHNGVQYWKKEIFPCFKFRTMHVNADTAVHQAYMRALIENNEETMNALQGDNSEIRKLLNDPRITRPGKLLRKMSLDELPQFWNVFQGDMSLVGPRPAIPYEVEMYRPIHWRRLEAQPGITGLQQIKARSTAEFDQQILFDIEYIESQSIWQDFKIMFMTPFAILTTRGAG